MDLIKKTSNPCTRCQKERIIGKTWKESVKYLVGETIIIHTETICPDPDCQKIVEEKLNQIKEKNNSLRLEREERVRKAQLQS